MKKLFILPFLLLLLLFLAAATGAQGNPASIDKHVTFQEKILLQGTEANLGSLEVNGHNIKLGSDGSFSLELILKLGKNYAELVAYNNKTSKRSVKEARLVRRELFPDLALLPGGSKYWAFDPIVNLATLGYIEAYPDGDFYPQKSVTRGELATWIARAENLALPTLTQDVLSDVPKEHWRAPHIKAVVDKGYMQEYSDGNFGIDDPVSRRDAAGVAVRAEHLKAKQITEPLFIDVPLNEEGASSIYVARENGLVKGVSAVTPIFQPDRALSRSEAAVLLARFKLPKKSISDLFDFNKGFSAKNYCGLNVAPEIISFTVDPYEILVGDKTIIRLQAQLAPRLGIYPIARVSVDLSEVGGVPDAEMFDDGSHGDPEPHDLIYSLNVSLEEKESASKTLTVSAVDQLGWETRKSASLLILER
ncbi:MAG: S-layer homology domain-containing protein [Candidatus Saganbacteria bacterium]|nr:S-layer homology domain-containing protein [Candidatus Saganbacteria bacterium]